MACQPQLRLCFTPGPHFHQLLLGAAVRRGLALFSHWSTHGSTASLDNLEAVEAFILKTMLIRTIRVMDNPLTFYSKPERLMPVAPGVEHCVIAPSDLIVGC